MMNPWHDFEKERVTPEKFVSLIEIPKKCHKKYELDKKTGLIRLDRILFTSTHYPQNYGFIPLTLSDDGDPLDVLVLCQEELDILTIVDCYPIGVLKMTDDNETDEKIIAIPFGDPTYNGYKDISELPDHIFNEMKHFFSVYKALENKETDSGEVNGREAAVTVIRDALDNYIEQFCK